MLSGLSYRVRKEIDANLSAADQNIGGSEDVLLDLGVREAIKLSNQKIGQRD